MRRRNWRVVISGLILIALALGFFIFMSAFAPQSLDPAEVMKTVGQVSGVLIGISVVMIVLGLIGKKA